MMVKKTMGLSKEQSSLKDAYAMNIWEKGSVAVFWMCLKNIHIV